MTPIPQPITISHRVWEATGQDGHGNLTGRLATPVPRKAMSVHQRGTAEPVATDTTGRVVTDIVVQVADPTLYREMDQVLIAGVAYQVQGTPADWRAGPWTRYSRLFGGEVFARRVGGPVA